MPKLFGTVTQGANDAFAQAAISTGLYGFTDRAFQVKRILYELPGYSATGSNVEASLTRKSFAAMPTLIQQSLIDRYKYSSLVATGVGFQLYVNVIEHLFAGDPGNIFVEDPIYLQIDSNGTAAANTALVVIEYDVISITLADRLALTQQLIA